MGIAISDNALQKESHHNKRAILRHYIKSGQDYIYGTTRTVQNPPSGYDLLSDAIIVLAYLDYKDECIRLFMAENRRMEAIRNFGKHRNTGAFWGHLESYKDFVKRWDREIDDYKATVEKSALFFRSPEYELLTSIPGEYLMRKAEEAARKYITRRTQRGGVLCRN